MVGVAVVGAAAVHVGSAVFGVANVDVTSCVLYGAVVSAVAVGTTACVRSNSWNNKSGCYLCVEWYFEPCVVQCQCVALSRDTIRLHVCGIKQGVVSKRKTP